MGLCFSSYPIEPYAQQQQQAAYQKTYAVAPSYQQQQPQTYYINPQQPVSQDPVNYASAPPPYQAQMPPPPYLQQQYYVVRQVPQQQQQNQGSVFLPALAGAMIGSVLGDAMFDD